MKEIISQIKKQAKQLSLDLSHISEEPQKEQLSEAALELLLNIQILETRYNQNNNTYTERTNKISKSTTKITSKNEDLIKNEINKISRRLPNWAIKQHHINAKILTLFLKLEEEGGQQITEQMLMERYGDQAEFYRNFPQMKTIAPKNHGKVFNVQNGVIEIWEPIKQIVHDYKKMVFKQDEATS
jgi:superoxide dismutase